MKEIQDNVWQEFLDFNQDEILNVGDKEDDYHYGLCDGYEAIDSETGETNKRFCMKLLKNVASASDPETLDINGYERCSYVNMWLYFYTKHYHVEDNFIKKIFEMVNGVMQQYESYIKCEYESYRDFLEPENIIKLSMFTENLDKILDIISNTRHTHHFACRRYIYECANILKRMLKEHCTVNKDKNAKYVKTCAELDTFKDSYYDYLYEDQSIIEIIPNLEAPIRKFEEDLALEKSDAPVVAQNDFLSGSLKRNLATGAVAAAGTGALLLALNKVNINYMYK
ncbi:hypothetical protein PVIIG_05449 [Plasmodium vivax India VII]|uniref:Uncharacterized protein n=1 Tax=Plasmodium vivax India VII TaxID=1077284 RepID=A0A0J9S2V0_PLAVI|nr:hypothetical protein PVIIG_05449 [Plasmodium vivax India VII]